MLKARRPCRPASYQSIVSYQGIASAMPESSEKSSETSFAFRGLDIEYVAVRTTLHISLNALN